MSAACFIASDEDRGVWVTSGTDLRLVAKEREIQSDATESTSAKPGFWTDPHHFAVSLSTDDGLRSFLESRLQSISEVCRVKVAERESRSGKKTLHVWTSLTRDDRATRFKVYEVEQQLVDHFSELLFEFHSHLARDDAPDGDTIVYEPNA